MALGLHRPNNLAMVIERVFFKTDLVNDNYFYSGYILGHYKPDNCPRYLMKENYEKMKKNLKVRNKKFCQLETVFDATLNSLEIFVNVCNFLPHCH